MIRWITEYLGTSPALSPDITPEQTCLDVRSLVDKGGNFADTIAEKISIGVEWLLQGKKLVVVCDYGISRSNAIAAGIYSVYAEIPLEVAIRRVMDATGEHEIKVEVLDVVRKALAGSSKVKPDTTRVLFTGGSGFIGQTIIPVVSKQHAVFAPSRIEIDLQQGAVQLDLLVKEHGITHLVHLANPRVYYSTRSMGESLIMLRNVLDVVAGNNLHLTYLSGWVVFSGYRSNYLFTNEKTPTSAKGVYAETKMLCERMIEHYIVAQGITVCLLRLPACYGEGTDTPKFLYNFIECALNDRDIVVHKYKNGHPALDLLYGGDVTSAILAALKTNAMGIFHLGREDVFRTFAIAEKIVSILGSASSITAAAIDDYMPGIVMDSAKARKLMGWEAKASFVAWLEQLLSKRWRET